MSQNILKDYEKSIVVSKYLLNIVNIKNSRPNLDEKDLKKEGPLIFSCHFSFFAPKHFL